MGGSRRVFVPCGSNMKNKHMQMIFITYRIKLMLTLLNESSFEN